MSTARKTPNKHAAAFGRELLKALQERGVTRKAVAEAAGCEKSSVSNYALGLHLPQVERAVRLAEVLDWPKLAEIVVKARHRTCDVCGKTFTDNGNGGLSSRTCSHACRHLLWTRKRRYSGVRSGVVTNHRWEVAVEQIEKHCWDCEPDGLCKTPSCNLRGLSSLPLQLNPESVNLIPFRKRA